MPHLSFMSLPVLDLPGDFLRSFLLSLSWK
jgi:hypothetical protein